MAPGNAAAAAIRHVFGALSTLDEGTLRALRIAVTELGAQIDAELARRAQPPRALRVAPSPAHRLPTVEEIATRFPPESRWQRADGADFAGTALRVRQCLTGLNAPGDWLHGVACSVRLQRYSMGRAISVVIKSVPPGLTLRPPAQSEGTPAYAVRRYTPEAQSILEAIEGVLAAHNRDRSVRSHDGGDTIYNVDFATHVTFGDDR